MRDRDGKSEWTVRSYNAVVGKSSSRGFGADEVCYGDVITLESRAYPNWYITQARTSDGIVISNDPDRIQGFVVSPPTMKFALALERTRKLNEIEGSNVSGIYWPSLRSKQSGDEGKAEEEDSYRWVVWERKEALGVGFALPSHPESLRTPSSLSRPSTPAYLNPTQQCNATQRADTGSLDYCPTSSASRFSPTRHITSRTQDRFANTGAPWPKRLSPAFASSATSESRRMRSSAFTHSYRGTAT